jgi:hypothetical protein
MQQMRHEAALLVQQAQQASVVSRVNYTPNTKHEYEAQKTLRLSTHIMAVK